ncbi:hypothetical protein ACHAXR_010594 [Thalassiosira sp. AJA248-18]
MISSSSSSSSSPSSSSSGSSVYSLKSSCDGEDSRPTQWPLRGIEEPGENDCLTGRGGGTNVHPGNIKYRKMMDDNKSSYLALCRLDKCARSMKIVQDWRSQNPPGRFLRLNDETKLWDDIGDQEARAKVSQSLREKRPSKLLADSCLTTLASVGETTSQPEADDINQLHTKSTGSREGQRRDSQALREHVVEPNEGESGALAASNIRNKNMQTFHDYERRSSSEDRAAQRNLSILSNSLLAIGIADFSVLNGTVEQEFTLIKKAYFATILRVHPDRNPGGDHVAFHCARTAFEVLRAMFHKIRAQRSSFISLFTFHNCKGDLGYINDLYAQICSIWHGNSNPSYEHAAMAARQDNPIICVELSLDCCHHCAKCNNAIKTGEIKVGSLSLSTMQEYGQWQHMTCWSVPFGIWLGIKQPLDPSATLRDVMSMDEVFVKGLTRLDLFL